MCQDVDNTRYLYYNPDYIDDLDPTDAFAGNQIKFWF